MASLYLEKDHPCPYLEKELSRNLFFHSDIVDKNQLDVLLSQGWRHFGGLFFRPYCRDCARCEALVIIADEFVPSKSQKRVFNKNADLSCEYSLLEFDKEHLDLINSFQKERALKKGWPLEVYTESSYRHAFMGGSEWTKEIQIRDSQGKLIGISIVDVGHESQSSVYFYSDPSESHRSLGTYSILIEVEWAKSDNRQAVYMGLWNDKAMSLAYKTKFGPSHHFPYQNPEPRLIQFIQENL